MICPSRRSGDCLYTLVFARAPIPNPLPCGERENKHPLPCGERENKHPLPCGERENKHPLPCGEREDKPSLPCGEREDRTTYLGRLFARLLTQAARVPSLTSRSRLFPGRRRGVRPRGLWLRSVRRAALASPAH